MPGLVAFGRRWSVGSDDLIVPALFLIVCNSIWVIVLACSLPSISAEQMGEKQAFEAAMAASPNPQLNTNGAININIDSSDDDIESLGSRPVEKLLPLRFLRLLLTGFVVVFLASVLLEGGIAYVSTRGSVMDQKPRHSMKLLVYFRACVLLIQFICCVLGIVWIAGLYGKYRGVGAAQILIAVIAWQFFMFVGVLLIACCVYDPTGRDWLKVSRYCNAKHDHSKCHPGFKRSEGRGNWRNRRLELQRQSTWHKRCQLLLFCVGRSDSARKKSMSLVQFADPEDSLAEIARLLSEFFSDVDVVPSDLVAGMMLLRHKQKRAAEKVLEETDNTTYQFLSGAAITPHTKFLELDNTASLDFLRLIRYYMQCALAAYGWLFYLTNNKTSSFCDLVHGIRCCGCCRGPGLGDVVVVEDNCCYCDLNALRLTLPSDQMELVYVSFHCGIGQTPFFVAVDHEKQSVVLCIRGTLSLRDMVTDLSAETEEIPVPNMSHTDWMAHKGIVRASDYVLNAVNEESLLDIAFEKLQEKSDKPLASENLIIVGHSLGGGISTVLGLMLRDRYPSLKCFVFSPPGGLLTWSAAEATRDFISTVVVGKDVVARIGLAQMENLKNDLLGLLKTTKDTKWKIIGHSLPCCRAEFASDSPDEPLLEQQSPTNSPLLPENSVTQSADTQNNTVGNSRGQLVRSPSKHQRLYMPGKVLHVVRTWTQQKTAGRKTYPFYSAIWAEPKGFDEVLISPVMVHDHMPEGVIDALDKLLTRCENEVSNVRDDVAQDFCPVKIKPPPSSPRPAPDGIAPLATPDPGLKFDSNYPRSASGPPGVALEVIDTIAPLKTEGKKAKVNFQIGLSASKGDVVEEMYRNHKDPDVEMAWEDIYRRPRGSDDLDIGPCWTESSSMVPEVSSIARLQDLDQISEAGSTADTSKVGFRLVATYAGGHLKDVGSESYQGIIHKLRDTNWEISETKEEGVEGLSPHHEALGKARSEAWLDKKADTHPASGAPDEISGNLHRTKEREDVRFGSLDDDSPGHMARSHEMENICSKNSDEVFSRPDSDEND